MSQADLFGASTPAPISEERRAAFDVDRTPRAIPRQVYGALVGELPEVRRILIPAAGSGPWAAEARALWPDAWIVAVEIRPEERHVLAQWCDHVITADIRQALGHVLIASSGFDVIGDNPPFSLLSLGACPHESITPQGRCRACGERKSQAEALRAYVAAMRPLLSPHGRLALYWLSDLGQRATGEDARALWDLHRPLYQMRVQPVEHREGRGVDLRSYSVWAWDREPVPGRRWSTWDLPALPKAVAGAMSRGWRCDAATPTRARTRSSSNAAGVALGPLLRRRGPVLRRGEARLHAHDPVAGRPRTPDPRAATRAAWHRSHDRHDA